MMIRFIPFEFLFFLYIRSRFFNSPTSRVPRTKKLQGIRLPTGKFTFYNCFLLSFQNVTSLYIVRLFEKHYVSRQFLVSMTDQNLQHNFLVSISQYVYNKQSYHVEILSINRYYYYYYQYYYYLLLSCKLLNQKKGELTIAFITPSWVAITCSQTLYYHFKVRLGREPP